MRLFADRVVCSGVKLGSFPWVRLTAHFVAENVALLRGGSGMGLLMPFLLGYSALAQMVT